MNMIMVDGIGWPFKFPEENYYLMKKLPLRDGDIILSTYPKCGSNWVAYILWGILHPGQDPPEGNRVLQMDIPLVDMVGLGTWTNSPETTARSLFTHLGPDRVSMNACAKYVVIVRNPFDCCVSFFHFMQALGLSNFEEDGDTIPDKFVDLFLSGDVPYGDLFDFIKSWYDRREDKNVHFMSYEDLKKNHKGGVIKLAKFLELEGPLEADDGKLLDKVVHHSSFAFMKKNVKYTEPDKKGSGQFVPVVRKGLVGGYKDTLTPQQVDRIRKRMEQKLAGTQLLSQWEKL